MTVGPGDARVPRASPGMVGRPGDLRAELPGSQAAVTTDSIGILQNDYSKSAVEALAMEITASCKKHNAEDAEDECPRQGCEASKRRTQRGRHVEARGWGSLRGLCIFSALRVKYLLFALPESLRR